MIDHIHWDFEDLARVLRNRQQGEGTPAHQTLSVAEWDGVTAPTPSAFREVVGQTATASEIAYLDQVPPRTEKLIFKIHAANHAVFLIAAVNAVQEIKSQRSSHFKVICRLIKRLSH